MQSSLSLLLRRQSLVRQNLIGPPHQRGPVASREFMSLRALVASRELIISGVLPVSRGAMAPRVLLLCQVSIRLRACIKTILK
jgi:hypothetical protein